MPLSTRIVSRLVLAVGCLMLDLAHGWEPVRLRPYPHKTRTFYPLAAPQAPAALRTNPVPLPVSGITALAVATDGAQWLGTTQGLIRLDWNAPARDRRHYMAGQRYLPDDRVRALAPDSARGMWVRTDTGLAHIQLRLMTLAQKAEWFEQRIQARHNRYGLVADSRLLVPGDPTSNQLVSNDNDGLWTALYAAAQCFRYRVTRAPQALANAHRSIEAILFLEEVAGRRGFPARSFIRKGDPLPRDGEWHWTDDGQYCWKGDTSSDEIVGHFFIFGVAFDLLPDSDLKRRMVQTATRIMDHILDHDCNLVDVDGQPTRWGWWGPAKLVQEPEERALNSLQLLSFLKTAEHLTGHPRYTAAYRKAAWDWQYADWVGRLNEFRTELNYSDEELAMLAFYGLFRYEKDPRLLAAYRRGLDQWWANMQRQANPLWTFIYLLGRPDAPVDLAAAVWTLYRMPLDTIAWWVTNSHRQDLVWAPEPDRFGRRQTLTLLPPDERPVMKWNSNPFVVDGGNGGGTEDDGAAFLLPYWLGRYHRFIVGE